MKITNNLGLKKIELTDSPPDITVQDSNWDLIDEILKEHEDSIGQVNSKLASTAKAERAGGTATAITLTNVALIDGSIKNFIVKVDNNAVATTINGKHLYKPNTITAPKLKANTAVSVWYDLTGDCFFIRASASGDGTALKGDVLAPKTIINEDGDEVTGTIPSKLAATYTPGTTDQTIAAGQYLSGIQTIKGDADLIAANILKGKDIFGVVGTMDHTDIIGQASATGICHESITKGDLVTTRRYFGFDTPVALPSPSTLPTGNGNCTVFSPDGMYLVVGHFVTPFISIYKRSGDTFTKLSNPSTIPTGIVEAVSFSQDGTYLAVMLTSTASPYVMIYKRSGDTFTKLSDLANPPTSPNGYAGGIAFSADGTYLAVAQGTTSGVYMYKRTGDVFNRLTSPFSDIVSNGLCVAFSPDANYFAYGTSGSPYLMIYKRSGDTFVKLPDPITGPGGYVIAASFSSDGVYLALALTSSPYLAIYKRSGDVFTKLTNPSILPTGIGLILSFSPDGTYLAVGHDVSPFITIYKRSGDTFTKLTNPTILPAGVVSGVAYNPLYPYLALAHQTTPFVTIYKADIEGDYLHKYGSFTNFYYPNYINFGFAKGNGALNDVIDITTLPIK